MAKHVLPFRTSDPVGQPTMGNQGPAFFQIGGRRYRFDFHVTATEVKPVDAEILFIRKNSSRPQRGTTCDEHSHSVSALPKEDQGR